MKNLITILLLLISCSAFAQLPYTWTAGANPGWTATNSGSGGTLTWQGGCNAVATNCAGNYSNNQNTFYTSPTINASCTNASTLNITYTINGNAEFGFDFLFIEYSLDNGVTWINPYGAGVGGTGNTGGTITTGPGPIPTSSTFKFRFNFYSDFSNRSTGYKITDFDITCNVAMPIELVYFKGFYDESLGANLLKWESASETNNHYYTIFTSSDMKGWNTEYSIAGAGTITSPQDYSYTHETNKSLYYKLQQTDYDGKVNDLGIVFIERKNIKEAKVIKIYNQLGQEVPADYPGIKYIQYDDGSTKVIK